MSWQATAYVKGLTRGITAYEKLLLFVLADYHNTHRNAAWPSVPLLAEESLMSERNCFNLLRALEKPREGHPGGILMRRKTGEGRGSITEYSFVDLDSETFGKGEANSPLKGALGSPIKGENPERNPERKGEYGDIVIRKSRGVESNKTMGLCPKCQNKGIYPHAGHPGMVLYCACSVGASLMREEKRSMVIAQ